MTDVYSIFQSCAQRRKEGLPNSPESEGRCEDLDFIAEHYALAALFMIHKDMNIPSALHIAGELLDDLEEKMLLVVKDKRDGA